MSVSILTARRIAALALVFFSIVVLGLSAHVETSVSFPLIRKLCLLSLSHPFASLRFTGSYVRPLDQELHTRMLHRRAHHRRRDRVCRDPMEETDADLEHGSVLPGHLGLLAR